MTDIEGSEGHNQSDKLNQQEGFAIFAKPFAGEPPQVTHTPDGGFTIYLRGEIHIAYQPPATDTAESFLQPVDTDTLPLPPGSEALRSQPQALQAEQTSASDDQASGDALKSPVTDAETAASGSLPETTSSPVTEPHSGAESASPPPSQTKDAKAVEQGNQLHEFIGNPTYDAAYWELKSGKRVAEFVLATHPEEGDTEYQRIRAFDGLAVYVRDNVRKKQKDVYIEAWGPKHWKSRNEKQMTGFYAKKVKVPKEYRPKQSD